MKRRIFLCITVFLFFVFFSCKTTEPAVTKAPEFDMESLNKAERSAFDSRTNADSIKAPVAVKDDYLNAAKTLESAQAAKTSGAFKDSLNLFSQADAEFKAVYDKALEKKNRADGAISDLNNTIDEVKKDAQVNSENQEINSEEAVQ